MRLPFVAAFALLTAGCIVNEADSPSDFLVAAPMRVTFGYAYDGEATQLHRWDGGAASAFWSSETQLNVRLNPDDETGLISIVVHGAAGCDGFVWDSFSGPQPYKEGGIATDLELHGDSGNDAPDFPTTHATVAAWGTAKVYANSVLWYSLPEPVSLWKAHFMYLDHSLRRDGKINNQTGGPYDPSLPGDAGPEGGRPEVHVRLSSNGTGGNGFDIAKFHIQGTLESVQHEARYAISFDSPRPGNATVHASFDSGSSGAASRLDLRLMVSDQEMGRATLTQASPNAWFTFPTAGNKLGTLIATGRGLGATYTVDSSVHVDGLDILMWGQPGAKVNPDPWVPDDETCGNTMFRDA